MKAKILFILFALLLFSCQLDKEQLNTSLEPLTKAQAMEVAQNDMGHSDLPYKYVYAFHQKPVPETINGVPAQRHSTYSFYYININ